MAPLANSFAPGFVEVLHIDQLIANCAVVKNFLILQVRTNVRELPSRSYADVTPYLRRLQVVRLRQAQAAKKLFDVEFRAAVDRHLDDAGLSRKWLGEQLGISESTISRLLSGGTKPSLEYIVAVEVALGLKRGTFLRQAGFVDDDLGVSLEQMISYDPRLNLDQRSTLLQIVRSFLVQNALDDTEVVTLPMAAKGTVKPRRGRPVQKPRPNT